MAALNNSMTTSDGKRPIEFPGLCLAFIFIYPADRVIRGKDNTNT